MHTSVVPGENILRWLITPVSARRAQYSRDRMARPQRLREDLQALLRRRDHKLSRCLHTDVRSFKRLAFRQSPGSARADRHNRMEKQGGSATSARKASATRWNGRKGGRPRRRIRDLREIL
jgi:hypothetical protein